MNAVTHSVLLLSKVTFEVFPILSSSNLGIYLLLHHALCVLVNSAHAAAACIFCCCCCAGQMCWLHVMQSERRSSLRMTGLTACNRCAVHYYLGLPVHVLQNAVTLVPLVWLPLAWLPLAIAQLHNCVAAAAACPCVSLLSKVSKLSLALCLMCCLWPMLPGTGGYCPLATQVCCIEAETCAEQSMLHLQELVCSMQS